jgi:hypothetical protein
MEHRRAKAMIEATAHAIITPIRVWFAIDERRDVIRFLNSRARESLLKAIVAMRRIWAAFSYCDMDFIRLCFLPGFNCYAHTHLKIHLQLVIADVQ